MTRTRVRYDRVAALLVSVALLTPVARGILGTGAQADERPRTYAVHAGDTLWGIAQRYDPDGGDPRAFVYEISAANHLDGSDIRPGQVLTIP